MTAGTCGKCGAPLTGRFCASCGAPAPAPPRHCTGCGVVLSPGAHFCHRCGEPTTASRPSSPSASRERTAWMVASVAMLLAVGGLGWLLGRGGISSAAAPAMANAGNAGQGLGGGGPAGAAPDISQMTPLERFTRLNDRVMLAAEQGDSITVVNFTPMALGAYGMLDTIDVDLRYHAAVLHAQVGDFTPALALADTILGTAPDNLFGYLLQATVARMRGDQAAESTARSRFRNAWDRQIATNRPEYIDHRDVLDAFRSAAP